MELPELPELPTRSKLPGGARQGILQGDYKENELYVLILDNPPGLGWVFQFITQPNLG
jgi:hypothetical protein